MTSTSEEPNRAREITLYHYRSSYWSQMVRLAFAENDIPYISKPINLLQGENYAPEYVAINPACEVPALTVSDCGITTTINGSQEIMDYLDSITDKNGAFSAHEKVQIENFRRRCCSLPIAEITLGIVRHPHLLEGAKLPQSVIDNFSKRVDRKQLMLDNIQKYPHLAEFYQHKLDRVVQLENRTNETTVREYLTDLETFLNQVDAQLRAVAEAHHSGPQQYTGWLFGKTFSNADFALATLLARLDLLGRAGRFWDMTERVFLADYYRRLKERPSFKQECVSNMS